MEAATLTWLDVSMQEAFCVARGYDLQHLIDDGCCLALCAGSMRLIYTQPMIRMIVRTGCYFAAGKADI